MQVCKHHIQHQIINNQLSNGFDPQYILSCQHSKSKLYNLHPLALHKITPLKVHDINKKIQFLNITALLYYNLMQIGLELYEV